MDQRFTTRLTLENCRVRLTERSEAATLFAFNHETRLVTKVWDLDLGVIGFMVYRAPKSAMQIEIGNRSTNAQGTIRHRADRGCDVLVHVTTSPMAYAMTVGLSGVLPFILVAALRPVSTWQIMLTAALWLVLTLISIGLSLRWLASLHAELLSIVLESLDVRRVPTRFDDN